jgi:hypothetical protein
MVNIVLPQCLQIVFQMNYLWRIPIAKANPFPPELSELGATAE